MTATNRTFLGLLGKFAIVVSVAVAFLFGLLATVYLSLRSPEVQVPNLVGQARGAGESELQKIGLNMRKRAERYSAGAQPDTIIDQSPRAGEMIKVGQTIAVIVSRPPKEGEETESAVAAAPANRNANENAAAENRNAENRNAENKNESNRNRNSANKNTNTRSAVNRNANNRNTNSANANNVNRNLNANVQNTNNRNANLRNLNTNTNRNANNVNTNRRPPVIATPPFNPNANRRP